MRGEGEARRAEEGQCGQGKGEGKRSEGREEREERRIVCMCVLMVVCLYVCLYNKAMRFRLRSTHGPMSDDGK